MLNGPAGLAGASAMHGYSIRMALVRFRMILEGAMIVCKRVLYEKVVYFRRRVVRERAVGDVSVSGKSALRVNTWLYVLHCTVYT